MKNHLRIQDNPKSCISWYFKTLFQTQIDLKYEVFHDMFALTSRIKSEAENRKPENWFLQLHFKKAVVRGSCSAGHTGKWEYSFSILEGANKEFGATRDGHNTRLNY